MNYKWLCPPGGPDARPERFVPWAIADLAGVPGRILCNPQDAPSLAGTILAERLAQPDMGTVQRGSIWLEA